MAMGIVNRAMPWVLFLDKMIARGGFSEVYSAHIGLPCLNLLKTGDQVQLVVVKLVKLEGEERIYYKFLTGRGKEIRPSPKFAVDAEIDVLSKLREEKFVTKFFGSCPLGQLVYIVLERCLINCRILLEGITLESVYFESGYPGSAIKHIMVPIFEALAHLHDLGYSHNDVKEDNILLTSNGVPKLSDFGLVTKIGDTRPSSDEIVGGTNFYMAPEVVVDDVALETSDIWSVAMTMLSMIHGGAPFPNSSIDWGMVTFMMRTPKGAEKMDFVFSSLLSIKHINDRLLTNGNWIKSLLSKLVRYQSEDRLTFREILDLGEVNEYLTVWHTFLDGGVITSEEFNNSRILVESLLQRFRAEQLSE